MTPEPAEVLERRLIVGSAETQAARTGRRGRGSAFGLLEQLRVPAERAVGVLRYRQQGSVSPERHPPFRRLRFVIPAPLARRTEHRKNTVRVRTVPARLADGVG